MKMFCGNISSVYFFAYLPFLGNLLHNTYYVNLPGYSIKTYEFKLLIMCYLIKSSSFAFPLHFAEIPRNDVDSI